MWNLCPRRDLLSPKVTPSLENLSEGNISDTISESSDNATLLSLSREDLVALGAGPLREDVRVNRKKLEALIIRERDNPHPSGKHYMEMLMERTNSYVQWPSRMKIGAKTKKDLYIRVYGHNQEDVDEAKNQILNDLGPHRDLRITLKMEISYTDHSHLIGCRGQTIRKVMDDTGCHIHFPDSNRMSKEHKSNQVTIAGSSVGSVEQARARVRELSPLVFQFSLPTLHSPYDIQMNADSHHIFIENIQASYGVQITIHPPNKLQQTTVSVKGCEVDAGAVKEAVGKIVAFFSGGSIMGSVQVESTMEISAVQHPFVRAINDSNVHSIMMNTGAKIIFPDLTDGNIQQIKRSRVYISGDINCVYNARQQLIGCLPLRMIFDLADDFQLDWEAIRQIGSELNVNVKMINRNRGSMERSNGSNGMSSLPPMVPGRSRTIQLIAHERNTSNMFEVRRRILGVNDTIFQANIPPGYHLRPTYPTSEMKGSLHQYGNRLAPMGPLPPLLLPTSPNMLSPVLSPSFWPPSPFGSPFVSPSIATCVMNSGPQNGGNNGPPAFANGGSGGPPPGIGKLTLSLQPPGMYSYTGLPSPSPVHPHPPEININNLKQSFHLPLMDPHTYHNSNQYQDSAMNTPMSLGGTSTFSDFSPMHPGVNMVNALINDFGNMDIKRRAPGCERSNTAPNLFVNVNRPEGRSAPGSSAGSRSESPSASNTATTNELQEVDNGNPGTSTTSTTTTNAPQDDVKSKEDALADSKAMNPTNEKKYMAVKAMYQTKIGKGNAVRVPNSEWSGCGFSKTYMNLFPADKSKDGASSISKDSGNGSIEDNWRSTSTRNSDNSSNGSKGGRDRSASGKEVSQQRTHAPLGQQQSNLLDFAATRPQTDAPAKDLASLFIHHGLGKYIDQFVSEEIDLDTFSTLNEGDLRSLGVSAYPARKKMLVLITQLTCPGPAQEWTNK